MKKYKSTISYNYGYCGTETEEEVIAEFDDDATPEDVQDYFSNYAWEEAIERVDSCGGNPELVEEEELEDGERDECVDCDKDDCDDCDNR